MNVRFGVLLTPGIEAPEAVVELARTAEALGYDLVMVPDRPYEPGLLDAWTLLSWVAARTERIRLAPGVLELPLRDPAALARAAAGLDLLSAGRLELALGAGSAWDAIDGREAGGWVATLAELPPDGFAAAGKLVDEAAREAGREPAEVRRIVVVGPDADLSALRTLAAEERVDTFVISTDDAAVLRRFAADLRDLPAAVPVVVRPASVRAKRRAGIDYDSVPRSLADTAVEPGDLEYARVRSTYLRGGAPGLVLRPRTVAEVVDALAFVRAHPHLPFGVRSGGHGISGRSTNDGGIVLSVAALNSVEVLDRDRRLVRVGPGARWTDVAAALLPYGWALSSGDYGGVGVGGLATAGGVGWLAREHGLTIDHLRAVEMVLADGSVVRASERENAELFWGVRGAGGNFGVVTSFEFQVDEVGDVGFAQLVVGADDPAELLVRWGAAIEASPRDVSGQLIMGRPRPGRPHVAQLMAVVDAREPETIIERLRPLASVGPLYDQNVVLIPYAGVMANAADGYHQGQGEPVSRSGLIEHLTPEVARAAADLLAGGAVHWFQIRTVGGAVSDVPPDATAYAHRSANFSLVVMGSVERRLDAAWAGMAGHVEGLYLNFETGTGPDKVAAAFPPATLARLRELKRRYDPGTLFRDNFTVDPQEETR
ncbi:hypothetical protein Asp14428_40070 [Actinoplanes sp. NBRC 14428]|nr:hypothetical protein Asp14428_40070 [Actinoplanes sp. NBRC 14428]